MNHFDRSRGPLFAGIQVAHLGGCSLPVMVLPIDLQWREVMCLRWHWVFLYAKAGYERLVLDVKNSGDNLFTSFQLIRFTHDDVTHSFASISF